MAKCVFKVPHLQEGLFSYLLETIDLYSLVLGCADRPTERFFFLQGPVPVIWLDKLHVSTYQDQGVTSFTNFLQNKQ